MRSSDNITKGIKIIIYFCVWKRVVYIFNFLIDVVSSDIFNVYVGSIFLILNFFVSFNVYLVGCLWQVYFLGGCSRRGYIFKKLITLFKFLYILCLFLFLFNFGDISQFLIYPIFYLFSS